MGLLDGRVIVVTGATSGIGERSAELFIQHGARVVVCGRRDEKGQTLAERLGPHCTFLHADVRREADVKSLVDFSVAHFGRIDCMFNNAGSLPSSADITSIGIAQFAEAIEIHVQSVLVGMKYCAPVMMRQGNGSIINMASIAGVQAGIGGLAYSTAKAAVLHMTRCAAVELGEHGVRVNSISPGPVVTGIFDKGGGMDANQADDATAGVKAALEEVLPATQPLRRVGSVDDVAGVALFLASNLSAMVSGHNLVVDGGATAGRPASVMRSQRVVFAKTRT